MNIAAKVLNWGGITGFLFLLLGGIGEMAYSIRDIPEQYQEAVSIELETALPQLTQMEHAYIISNIGGCTRSWDSVSGARPYYSGILGYLGAARAAETGSKLLDLCLPVYVLNAPTLAEMEIRNRQLSQLAPFEQQELAILAKANNE